MTTISIKITDAEWEIMRVAWAKKMVTSKEITTILENKKNWKVATIKTLVGRLVDKGALQTIKEGNKFIYSAAVTEEESMDFYTDDILSRVCLKQSGHVISNMIAEATLSKIDIAILKKLLAQKEQTALEEVPCECELGQCVCHLDHH